MKNRKRIGGKYYLETDFVREKEFKSQISDYEKKLEDLALKKEKGENTEKILSDVKNSLNKILERQNQDIQQKNILAFSSFEDKKIGNGQDSLVFEFTKNFSYIYKESFYGKEENYLYLKNKYLILKKYLGKVIPKSYFVFGEGATKLGNKRYLKGGKYISEKIFTVQRKVKGKDFSKFSKEEKKDLNMLSQLEKEHKKYILLKYFISTKIQELGLSKKTMDLQLDLGFLSKKDRFSSDDINFIDKKLTSPNIMWDGKQIYFIDFGSGVWNENKQKVFDYMMDEKTISDWKNILKSYNLN